VKKILLGVVLVAAVLAPAASASQSHRVKLAVVVLPKSALGAAGGSLAVSPDSAVISNLAASASAISSTASTFDDLGRITGYALTYGDQYSGRAGITEISTSVDKYKTSAAAKRGLAFWRKDDPKITVFQPYGLPVTVKALKTTKVGTRRFAEGTTITVPPAAALNLVDEHFTDGRYELRVSVAAGSLSAAADLAGKLARKLDHRLRLAEAGRLRGKPVKVPPRLDSGPPPGGPDLATLALTSADLGGQATIQDDEYATPSPPAISTYLRDMEPAGDFADLSQFIDWFPAADDATQLARFEGVAFAWAFSEQVLASVPGQFTPVDISAVGDNAYGAIVSIAQQGQPTVYVGIVALSSGQAADLVLVARNAPIQASDLLKLAQTTANRFDTGLTG
jgi:opacity protein-like surface antigen